MSALTITEEFSEPVFTRDRRAWWSGLATPGVNTCTDERLTVREAVKRYLPWDVRKVELVDPEGPQRAGIFLHKRSDTDYVLGSSTDRWHAFQNNDVADLLEEAIGDTDYAVASVGALRYGALTFISVDFDGMPDLNAGGQVIHPYLSIINPHTGEGAIRPYASGIRPECSNTISLGWLAGHRFRTLNHTVNIRDRVPALQAEIRRYLDLAPRAESMMRRLISRKVSSAKLRDVLEVLTPIPGAEHRVNGKVKNVAAVRHAEERRDAIRLLALADDRVGYVGTAWGAFQALSTYAQQDRGFRNTDGSGVDSRAASTMVDHFSVRQERNDSAAMAAVLRAFEVDDVKVTKAGLVLV